MGDKKTEARAEARQLITERLPQRVAVMEDEVFWAVGLKKLPRGHTPPIWVRRLICDSFGMPHPRARSRTAITREDVAKMIGVLSGMASGGRILLEQPLDTSGMSDEGKSAAADFQKRMGDVARPQFERADAVLAQISSKWPNNTPETAKAFYAEQSEVVGAIFSDDEDSVSDEVCFLLWVFWPEAKTSKSVRELHDWIARLGFIQCGEKNFEKICRKIGFRGSSRGRRKRR